MNHKARFHSHYEIGKPFVFKTPRGKYQWLI
jgi:hypothetical protein